MPHPSSWSREIPVRAIGQSVRANPGRVFLLLGIWFRLAQYLADRPYWMDEASLVGCINHLKERGLFGKLESTQLAPPGFLAGEWLVTRVLGTSEFAFRLLPLLAGIAALFLLRGVARRCLPTPRAQWLALALGAVAGDLIYFASEVKQYSSDMAITLGLLLLTLRAGRRGPATGRQMVGMAVGGAGVVWFSHPAIFTLAAIGTVRLWQVVRDRSPGRMLGWVGVGTAWVASFALVHLVAIHQLGHRPDMWVFWDFAFPTLPPRSTWDLLWPVRRLAFLFASPLNFDAPFGPRWSIWPAFGLTLLGWIRLARRVPGEVGLITLPGLFALLAAYCRLYPFHGRLLLFCVALILIPLAAGLDAIRPRPLRWFLLGWVLGLPALDACYRVVEPRQRDDANPYGDRRPPTLNPYWFPLAQPPSHRTR